MLPFLLFYLLVHYAKKDNFLFKLHFKPEAELGNEGSLLKYTEAPQTCSWKMVQFSCTTVCGATNILMGKGPYMLNCYQCHARQSSSYAQRISRKVLNVNFCITFFISANASIQIICRNNITNLSPLPPTYYTFNLKQWHHTECYSHASSHHEIWYAAKVSLSMIGHAMTTADSEDNNLWWV